MKMLQAGAMMLAMVIATPALASSDALSARLRTSIQTAEEVATRAQYPRANVVNFVMKTMWQEFYDLNPPLADERAAVDALLAGSALTPIQRECALRMQKELTYN